MRRFYLRTAGYGLSEQQQRGILASWGLDADEDAPAYIDGPAKKRRKEGEAALPDRERMMRSLRKGDEVVVAEEGIIGLTPDDTLRALAQIAEKSAVLVVARTGNSYAYEPRDALMADLLRDGEHQRKSRRAAFARQNNDQMGKGGVKALKGAVRDRAKEAWFNPKLSGAEVVKEFGVSRATFYNEFGPRNAPDATQKGRRR